MLLVRKWELFGDCFSLANVESCLDLGWSVSGRGTGELWKEHSSEVGELEFSLSSAASFPGQSWPGPCPFWDHSLFYEELVWLISERHSCSSSLWFIQRCYIPSTMEAGLPHLGLGGLWHTSQKCSHSVGYWAKRQLCQLWEVGSDQLHLALEENPS